MLLQADTGRYAIEKVLLPSLPTMGTVNTEALPIINRLLLPALPRAVATTAFSAAASDLRERLALRSPEHQVPTVLRWRLRGFIIVALYLVAALAQGQTLQPLRSLKEMRERGVVMQHWETSCAAAAVATVLTYGFHDPVGERLASARMLEQTDPMKVRRRGGFSLLDLKHFVDGRGYRGNAYKHLGLDDLRVFHAPIVPIDQHGYHHYVVFNGITGDQVLLADPAFGNRTLSITGFMSVWLDGMAFVVTRPPSPEDHHE